MLGEGGIEGCELVGYLYVWRRSFPMSEKGAQFSPRSKRPEYLRGMWHLRYLRAKTSGTRSFRKENLVQVNHSGGAEPRSHAQN